MKEEKYDRVIRKIVNDHFIPEPSGNFVDNVMGELGVKPAKSTLKTKPLMPKRGLILMGILYVVIIALIFIIPGSMDSTAYELPKFNLPALSDYIQINQNLSRMLIFLIVGGWLLLFFDNYIRKFFAR
jgi:hypothetical protein